MDDRYRTDSGTAFQIAHTAVLAPLRELRAVLGAGEWNTLLDVLASFVARERAKTIGAEWAAS